MAKPYDRGESYGVKHSGVERSMPLSAFVAALATDLSADELISLGSVYVNDVRATNANLVLSAGDQIRIHTTPRRFAPPDDLKYRVVEETDEWIVVDKPAGLPVHALVDNSRENLISYLEQLRGEKLYITHRLDVDTSGLLLFAKTPQAQTRINHGFAEGTFKRTYVAYTLASVALGTHVHFMEPSPKAPKTVSLDRQEGWLRCELEILKSDQMRLEGSVIKEKQSAWQLAEENISGLYRNEIRLKTGRPQQIRAQLSALDAPILGDSGYGSVSKLLDAKSGATAIALRAVAISMSPDQE